MNTTEQLPPKYFFSQMGGVCVEECAYMKAQKHPESSPNIGSLGCGSCIHNEGICKNEKWVRCGKLPIQNGEKALTPPKTSNLKYTGFFPHFKVWNSNSKSMIEVGQIQFMEDGQMTINDGFLICDYQAIVLHSSGKKCKEGKEIFAGDILECPHFGRMKVEYSDGCFWCTDIGDEDSFAPLYVHLDQDHEFFATKIGNIYENPELLKGGSK